MIGVVLNPNARGVRRDPAMAERMSAILGRDGVVAVTRTPAELKGTIDRFVDLGCDPIAVCGGDGTNLSTVSQLIERMGAERLPRFAILGGGTVNTVAKNLAIRGRPEELLARIVARVRAGEELAVVGQDVLSANGQHGFLFAAAMGARFLEAYYGAPVQGAPAATVLALRTAVSSLFHGSYARWLFAPLEVEMVVDGTKVELLQARLLLATTVPDVGIGMKVGWQAGREAGRFHFVASGISTTAMALQLHKVLAGRPLGGEQHVDRLARAVDLTFAQTESWTLDGELFRGRHVALRIGPRIRIVRP